MDVVHKVSALRAMPLEQWVTGANRYLPQVSTWLLVIVIAWYLARIVWTLVPGKAEFDWSLKSPVSARVVTAADSTSIDYQAIASAHLFGIPGEEPVIAPTTVDAPETQLNLKLRGTIAADDPSLAHAIIADGRGEDDVYFINDKVPGGAQLYEVYADRVILNRAGALETLRLPKVSESGGRSAPVTRATMTPVSDEQPASLQQAMADSGASSFTDILRPQPFMPNGELRGYRIYPGRDRRKFASLGFRPGDLVTEVNGQLMNDLQSGMEVFQELASATQLTVTIERAGQPMVITVDSGQLDQAAGAEE